MQCVYFKASLTIRYKKVVCLFKTELSYALVSDPLGKSIEVFSSLLGWLISLVTDQLKVGTHREEVVSTPDKVLSLSNSNIQYLFGKAMLLSRQNLICKFCHLCLSFRRETWLPSLISILLKLHPVDKDDLIVDKSQVGFEKLNSNFSRHIPGYI